VSCRRYPQLDGFTGNLRRWQLANGWHWECQKCSKICYGQEEGQDLDPNITTVIDDDDHVFCCLEHCREYEAYWGMHHAIDQAILEDFKKLRPGEFREGGYFVPGHNDWHGWVNTATERVVVWEMVSVHQQSYFVAAQRRLAQSGAEP
jgi:hypothetical protein